jgi:hypothetical protein
MQVPSSLSEIRSDPFKVVNTQVWENPSERPKTASAIRNSFDWRVTPLD